MPRTLQDSPLSLRMTFESAPDRLRSGADAVAQSVDFVCSRLSGCLQFHWPFAPAKVVPPRAPAGGRDDFRGDYRAGWIVEVQALPIPDKSSRVPQQAAHLCSRSILPTWIWEWAAFLQRFFWKSGSYPHRAYCLKPDSHAYTVAF